MARASQLPARRQMGAEALRRDGAGIGDKGSPNLLGQQGSRALSLGSSEQEGSKEAFANSGDVMVSETPRFKPEGITS